MKVFRILACCLFVGSFLATTAAYAKEEGFYVGASVGSVSIEEDISDIDDIEFDESDFAFKIFGGYQFSGLFAVEGGYVDFGNPSDSNFDVDAYGLDAFGVVGLPIGPIRAFGKLGGIYWDAEAEILDTFSADDDGFDLAAGLGLEFELASFAIRGEVEYFDFADSVWMYTVGATLTF